jgi:NAD-dependent DNA ligase
MSNILVTSDYRPQYIVREPEFCPHCKSFNSIRTNRYLFRCANYEECGRYW